MDKLSRREFIGSIAGVGAAIFIGGSDAECASSASKVNRKVLAVASGDSPRKNTREAVNALGGMKQFVKKGDFVVIKPNISWNRAPGDAATTNPHVVAELVKMCREAGAGRVLVIDHIIDRPAEAVLNYTGIAPAVEKAGGETSSAQNESDYRSIGIPKGKLLKKDTIIKEIAKADVFINVPIAKTHSATTLTLGLKNLMGCNWDRGAWHSSSSLDQCIADYATAVRPDLTILDANRILLTRGPKGPGETKDVKKVIAGVDPVAVDAYGATLFGKNAASIRHIKLAGDLGIGEIDLSRLTIKNV